MNENEEFLDAIDRRLSAIERKTDFVYREVIRKMGKNAPALSYCSTCGGFLNIQNLEEISTGRHEGCSAKPNEGTI